MRAYRRRAKGKEEGNTKRRQRVRVGYGRGIPVSKREIMKPKEENKKKKKESTMYTGWKWELKGSSVRYRKRQAQIYREVTTAVYGLFPCVSYSTKSTTGMRRRSQRVGSVPPKPKHSRPQRTATACRDLRQLANCRHCRRRPPHRLRALNWAGRIGCPGCRRGGCRSGPSRQTGTGAYFFRRVRSLWSCNALAADR